MHLWFMESLFKALLRMASHFLITLMPPATQLVIAAKASSKLLNAELVFQSVVKIHKLLMQRLDFNLQWDLSFLWEITFFLLSNTSILKHSVRWLHRCAADRRKQRCAEASFLADNATSLI